MIVPLRRSPLSLPGVVTDEESRDGWQVVLAYRIEGDGDGPWLVDLSHHRRWDFQHGELDSQRPLGLEVPAKSGQVSLQGDLLISRMNSAQACIWRLGRSETARTAEGPAFTDLTDAQCLLAVTGAGTCGAMEQLSKLDLFDPGRQAPFLTQGLVMHVPCQIVTLASDCVLMSFNRGYGQTLAEAMLQAACAPKLRPAGQKIFNEWVATGNSTATD